MMKGLKFDHQIKFEITQKQNTGNSHLHLK